MTLHPFLRVPTVDGQRYTWDITYGVPPTAAPTPTILRTANYLTTVVWLMLYIISTVVLSMAGVLTTICLPPILLLPTTVCRVVATPFIRDWRYGAAPHYMLAIQYNNEHNCSVAMSFMDRASGWLGLLTLLEMRFLLLVYNHQLGNYHYLLPRLA